MASKPVLDNWRGVRYNWCIKRKGETNNGRTELSGV